MIKFLHNLKLKYHNCKNNLIKKDNYINLQKGLNSFAIHQVTICTCSICNKRYDID
jgi:hypothetical protein